MSVKGWNPRKEAILKYIKEHPGVLKAEVINYMKGTSATATTHKILHECIDDHLVIVTKDEKNSQMHHLFINDKNTFNRINQELADINALIDTIQATSRRMPLADDMDPNDNPEQFSAYVFYCSSVLSYYRDSIQTILQLLLAQMDNTVPFERSQILYTRVGRSMRKLSMLLDSEKATRLLNIQISLLKRMRKQLCTKPYTRFESRKKVIDVNMIDVHIAKIEDFKKAFLVAN